MTKKDAYLWQPSAADEQLFVNQLVKTHVVLVSVLWVRLEKPNEQSQHLSHNIFPFLSWDWKDATAFLETNNTSKKKVSSSNSCTWLQKHHVTIGHSDPQVGSKEGQGRGTPACEQGHVGQASVRANSCLWRWERHRNYVQKASSICLTSLRSFW